MRRTNEQVLGEQVGVEHVTKVFSQILRSSDAFALGPAGLQRVPPCPLHPSGDSPALTCTADSSLYQNLPTWISTSPGMSVLSQRSAHWSPNTPEHDIRGPEEPGPSISYSNSPAPLLCLYILMWLTAGVQARVGDWKEW